MSRTVAGGLLFEVKAKEVLRKMLWEVADFCGVEVMAYCVMTNHFHVLVRVRERSTALDREEILRRYAILYGGEERSPEYPSVEGLAELFAEDGEEGAKWEERLRARMDDVSEFMKTLKQRFSIWYNRTHRRFGTLWSERFRSVLVENTPFAMRTVAAYIDLNPVRAGLVEEPGEYRWCSYAEAMGGEGKAQAGLAQVVETPPGAPAREVLAAYRVVLFGRGGRARRSGEGAISAEKVREVLAAGGAVEVSDLLQHRVAFLTAGAVLGSAAFVAEVEASLAQALMLGAGPHEDNANGPGRTPPRLLPSANRCLRLEEGTLVTLRRPRRSRNAAPDAGEGGDSSAQGASAAVGG